MNGLVTLICLTAAIAQGQGPTAEDHRTLADIGLKVVGGRLVDARSYVPPRPSARPRGPRQGGPVCYWWFAGGLDGLGYMEPSIDEYTSFSPSYDTANSGVTSYFSDSVIQAPIVPIIGPLYSEVIKMPPVTVFEPGNVQPIIPVVIMPPGLVAISEPYSIAILGSGLCALIALGYKRKSV